MSRARCFAPAALVAAACVAGSSAFAQGPTASFDPDPAGAAPTEPEAPQTLFSPHGRHAFGGFGAIEPAYTYIAHRDAAIACVEGGLILDHALTLGASFCGVGTQLSGEAYGNVVHAPGDKLEIGYGGFAARYHFFATRMVHFSLGATVGGGTVAVVNVDERHASYGERYDHDGHAKEYDSFFMVEPRLTGYLNITRWARLGAFGGYRAVSGVDMKNLTSRAMSGPTAGASLQFGWM
jgi:hypothetical protein